MFDMLHIPKVDAISRSNGISDHYYDWKSVAISNQFSKN